MEHKDIFDIISKENDRQVRGIELIASENYTSDSVMKAAGSCLTNKYAEGYPNKRYYGGCEVVDEIELIAIDRAKKLFGAEYANVQPHAGSQANTAVFHACLNVGDKILGFDLSHGGHLTHGSPVNFSGKLYTPSFYGVETNGYLDYDKIQEIAIKEQPKLIIAGASAYCRDMDFKRFREIADSVGAILMGDISHPAGLIVKGLLNNPIPHCHIVTTTTHKTLRGPRGGLIVMGKDFPNPNKPSQMMSKALDLAVFPGNQGGPLMHIIAAKAIAFEQCLSDEFYHYQIQVQKNAKAIAESFIQRGYNLISNGTDNHMILIDLRSKGITGKEAEEVLGKADITINKNMIPYDNKSPFITSGIRIGTPAITTRGLVEDDMETIVGFIDTLLMNRNDVKIINEVKIEVNKMMNTKPIFL